MAIAANPNARVQQGKYNEVIHQAIVDSVRAGNYRGTAARLVGIHETTLQDWMRGARDYREQGLEPDECPHPGWYRLLIDIEEAEADFEQQMVSRVAAAANSGAPNTWQAAMTILERKMPEKFGKRDALKISGDAENPLQVEAKHVLDRDEARSLGRDFLRSVTLSRAMLSGGDGIRDESAPDEIEGTAEEVNADNVPD